MIFYFENFTDKMVINKKIKNNEIWEYCIIRSGFIENIFNWNDKLIFKILDCIYELNN